MKQEQEKHQLHIRNKHRYPYRFQELIKACPNLKPFVKENAYGEESVNFFDPAAVKTLNTALLKSYYGIKYWDFPKDYLCPPIPGRADYIHYVADLLAGDNDGIIPKGNNIRCLDIGVGANCIFPVIGHTEYRWSFIGSDIDPISIQSAQKIVELNPTLIDSIELRLQTKNNIFKGILKKDERVDLVICNPPFHSSRKQAQKANIRKLRNLKQKRVNNKQLNFGGQSNELWCEGGEQEFVRKMIDESKEYADKCKWFTSLISKEAHLEKIYRALKKVRVPKVKTIAMGQGNKTSRIVAWQFV